jgi:glycosyltransferase involved in cell wall biosynthesis
MHVTVATEARLIKGPDGTIYGRGPMSYDLLSKYLQVFEEVVAFARVQEAADEQPDKLLPVEGEGVRVFQLPCYVGPWQFLKRYRHLNVLAEEALAQADAYILRVPGAVGTLLWRHLMKNKLPYGVEVVGDPWDVFAQGSVDTFLRPLIRQITAWQLAQQCRYADVAAYVTEHTLQNRYPPGGWTTHYSSINLRDEEIADESIVAKRISRLEHKKASNQSFQICYVGSMSQLYKAPDILIKALALCLVRGLNLELTMVGDGRFRPRLEELACQLGVAERVKFTGTLLRDEVLAQMDKADLFILCSRTEGLPRSMIEAMAQGLPCIGSNVGGIPELLGADDLVPGGDVGALAQKIEEVTSDISRLKAMALRNLMSAGKYREEELDRRRKAFYERLAEATQEKRKKTFDKS